MSKSRTDYARSNIIHGCINKMVALGLPFIIRTIILYSLGSKYLGLDSLFTSILQMLNLAELGFSSAVVFCMYKPMAKNDTDTICALLNFYRTVYRIIGVVVLGIGLLIMPFLDNLIKDDVPDDINIYSLYLIFLINTVLGYLLYSYKSSILIASQRSDITSYVNTVIIFIQSAIQVVVVILFKNYYIYIIIMPIFTIINNLVIAYITSKRYPQYVCKGKLSSELLHDLKFKISGLMISKFCVTSRNSMDSIIISSFAGLTQVAMYGNYYYIMAAVHSVLSIITKSISASVGNSIATESREKNYKDMMKFVFLYSWLAGICATCLLNIYQPFVKIWAGEKMMFPVEIVIAFVIYFFSLTLGDVRTIYMTGAGLWWEGRYRSVAETITNLVLNIVLGKTFGIIGVICATIISILVINFGYGSHILFKYYFQNNKTKNYFLLQIYSYIVVIISCFATWVGCSFVTIEGVIGLIFRAVICLIISNVIYVIFYFKLPVFKDSVDLLKKILKR